MFGGTKVDTMATPGLGAVEDATRPNVVDDKGMGVAGWAMVASVATGSIDLPLFATSAATSTTSNDHGISTLGGAA